jgi:uncharacterized integral membrane protein (TIGR00698 family)
MVVGVALVALESLLPWLPAPLVAIASGVVIGRLSFAHVRTGAGIAAVYFLRAGIVLLGVRLSIDQLARVGADAALVIVVCVLLGAGAAFWFAHLSRLNRRLSTLLAVGTGICGNSAIAAVAPSIGADDDEVAASITTVTLYGTIALVVFPLVASWMGLPERAFAIWAGTAINDTSQVVASAFSMSDRAGEIATIVKLARNLFIVPAALLAAWFGPRLGGRGEHGASRGWGIPWFVVLFVGAAALASAVTLPETLVDLASLLSKGLILAALTGIGMRAASLRVGRTLLVPMAVGAASGAALAAVSLWLVHGNL